MRATLAAAFTLLAIPLMASGAAFANPQKSEGVATACWSRGGVLTKVKIGHEPWEPCASGEQELKILVQDIPHMRERRYFVKVPAGPDEFTLLKFEGFHVAARCNAEQEVDRLDAWLSVTDDEGQELANVENTEHQYLLQYEDPAMAARWGREVGDRVLLSLSDQVGLEALYDGYCYFHGVAQIHYLDEAMSIEEWGALEDSWNAQ
jgi:hypothetical protein